jgi:ligand-binding sensor domain-containing protein
MRFSFALSFLTASAVQAMDPSSMKLQKEFMAAMHAKADIKAAAKVGKIQKLQERLIQASRKLESYGKYDAFLADQDGNIYYQGNDGLYYTANGQQVSP